jgi:DNA-binding NarL/FixJ family response regulator
MHDAEVRTGTSPCNYQVLWFMEVEASSVEEAANHAHKTQKTQNASTAQYRAQRTRERASEVSPADLAPLELLSEREREVAKLVAGGVSNAEIAARLGITLRTVKAHLSQIFQKLGVRNRINLMVVLLRAGGMDPAATPGPSHQPTAQNNVVLG